MSTLQCAEHISFQGAQNTKSTSSYKILPRKRDSNYS